MERWVPIAFVVFLGLAAVVIVVFTTIYAVSGDPGGPGDPAAGPRLTVYLVPPPRGPRHPANSTAPTPRTHSAWAAPIASGWNDTTSPRNLANLAALAATTVFPVDSSSPELFILRPEGWWGSDVRSAAVRSSSADLGTMMDVPGGPGGGSGVGSGGGSPSPTTTSTTTTTSPKTRHKILRGDRRMFSGEGDDTPARQTPRGTTPPATPRATPPVAPNASAASNARGDSLLGPSSRSRASTTSPSKSLPAPSSSSSPKSTPPTPTSTSTPSSSSPLAVTPVNRELSPIFVRGEDAKALLEDSIRQMHPRESAIMRKAMKALMEAYERHRQLEDVPVTTRTAATTRAGNATSNWTSTAGTPRSTRPPGTTGAPATARYRLWRLYGFQAKDHLQQLDTPTSFRTPTSSGTLRTSAPSKLKSRRSRTRRRHGLAVDWHGQADDDDVSRHNHIDVAVADAHRD